MVKNTDKYSKAYIPMRWPSLGFTIYDSYDGDIETKKVYGTD